MRDAVSEPAIDLPNGRQVGETHERKKRGATDRVIAGRCALTSNGADERSQATRLPPGETPNAQRPAPNVEVSMYDER